MSTAGDRASPPQCRHGLRSAGDHGDTVSGSCRTFVSDQSTWGRTRRRSPSVLPAQGQLPLSLSRAGSLGTGVDTGAWWAAVQGVKLKDAYSLEGKLLESHQGCQVFTLEV